MSDDPLVSIRTAATPARTPLIHNPGLSEMLACRVLLKCENLAPTGSFKYRGALRKLDKLGDARHRGVVAASTGNHGKAVAFAGGQMNAPVRVFVPNDAASYKVDAIRALGADVVSINGSALDAEHAARAHSYETGRPYISPYNDPDVIAGSAAIAHEILQETPDTEAIFVSVGGGGLLAGVGTMAKSLKPALRMVGCWPRNADSLYQSLRAGQLHPVDEKPTLSEGTAGGAEAGSITFPICQAVLDEAVLVTEEEIAEAMWLVSTHANFMVEGAAGVALAGLVKTAPLYAGKSVAVVLCGGNIDPAFFRQVVTASSRG